MANISTRKGVKVKRKDVKAKRKGEHNKLLKIVEKARKADNDKESKNGKESNIVRSIDVSTSEHEEAFVIGKDFSFHGTENIVHSFNFGNYDVNDKFEGSKVDANIAFNTSYGDIGVQLLQDDDDSNREKKSNKCNYQEHNKDDDIIATEEEELNLKHRETIYHVSNE